MDRRGFLKMAATAPVAPVFAAYPGSMGGVLHAGKFDLAVIGGSTTGVFAAVRAARAGLKVAIVENNALFGGTATAGFVPIWHSMYSMKKRRIVAGLSAEIIDKMVSRGEAVTRRTSKDPCWWTTSLNVAALSIALDEMISAEKNITPFLSARFTAALTDRPGHVEKVFIEDKDGRRELSAGFFIDATGDADLLDRAGFETWKLPPSDMQAHTLCAIIANEKAVKKRHPGFSFHAVLEPENAGGFNHVFGWDHEVIGCPDVTFNAFTRISDIDPSVAGDLTKAMIEARVQLKRIIDHAKGASA